LDAALDGCTAALSTVDDVRINVRTGASLDFPIAGSVFADDVTNLKGISEDGRWYRIDFRGGFGWVLSTNAEIQGQCAGLRSFEPAFGPEDATQYAFLGDPITLDDLQDAQPETSEEEPQETDEETESAEGEG
ncbi:MAG: SH3 domain-containing protein, partial [Chloroflexota bacterium]